MTRNLFSTALASALFLLPSACLRPNSGPPSNAMTTSNQPPRSTVLPVTASPIDFARIAAFPAPGGQVPRRPSFSPDGNLLTFLQSDSEGEQMALFALEKGKSTPTLLLRAAQLVQAGKKLSREEELRRERQRKRISGVTHYAWAKNKNVLMLSLMGNVYARDESGKIEQLSNNPAPDIDPKICSDASKVAFSRSRELYMVHRATKEEVQLTRGAGPNVTRGQSDFNMQEEFDEPSGLWWSPSCDRLAYLEVDETKVGRIPVMGYRKGADLQHHRYPRTGTTNPTTRLGIMDIETKQTLWVDLPKDKNFDPNDNYLGRLHFGQDGKNLFLQRLSRNQKHLALVRVDIATGKAEHILEHHDSSWTAMTKMRPLSGDQLALIWPLQERNHLVLVDGRSGKVNRQLSQGDFDVFDLVDADAEAVMFIANKDAVLDRSLYRADHEGNTTRLSKEPGVHSVTGSLRHGFVDIHSARDRFPRAEVFKPDGTRYATLEVPKDKDFEKLALRTPEFISIERKAKPTLYGAMLKPRNHKPGQRYPAIVMVYGGPHVQTVTNQYNPRLLWQHLADRGFVVFQIDNRGSSGRGHAFESPIYHRMGEVELADQLEGLDWLQEQQFVDKERCGIYGHSYGGYMALMAMFKAPLRFKAAVSGSPVVDWRYYDTGYTERYMSTPANNPEGYATTELSHHASALQGKLFIIHALMDENVHFAHTAKAIDALIAADKDFDLMVFPGERHGYRSPQARRYAYRRVVDYFANEL